MIKIDLKKAFDMVDWEFLMQALVGFGFPQRYCGWIRKCVNMASYSISLNGSIYGYFSGQRGLRQEVGITHLVYVDDLMLFARADKTSINVLAGCLEQFGCEAGLKANPLKSHIYMIRVDVGMKGQLLQITRFQEGTFPFWYLGIPIATEKLQIANYDPPT
ncbi:uncharacterized protein LOC122050283 [Zingiber officinale]|uniref:uncharacterized protein LOC122050283 n=1 Tax=Zingiber officinale TaxID=94328 RepID=UPI001C4C41F4|nr:uncharacterized protein LOC122050283 [Zingiber officinale]